MDSEDEIGFSSDDGDERENLADNFQDDEYLNVNEVLLDEEREEMERRGEIERRPKKTRKKIDFKFGK